MIFLKSFTFGLYLGEPATSVKANTGGVIFLTVLIWRRMRVEVNRNEQMRVS